MIAHICIKLGIKRTCFLLDVYITLIVQSPEVAYVQWFICQGCCGSSPMSAKLNMPLIYKRKSCALGHSGTLWHCRV